MSDQELMAYVDGELDAAECAAFEARLAQDPTLRQALTRERSLRELLGRTYAPVLGEAQPERLAKLLTPPAVVSLAKERVRRRPNWQDWGGIAASLLLGLLVGSQWLPQRGDGPLAQGTSGALVAQGDLALGLDQRLAGQQQAGVTPGLSFVAHDGRYCRSFTMTGAPATAGLACREAGQWQLQQLVIAPAATSEPSYRMAGSAALPQALLQAVDALRAGEVLDSEGERQARERGWQR